MSIKPFWRYFFGLSLAFAALLIADAATARNEETTLLVEKSSSSVPDSGDALAASVLPGRVAPEIIRQLSGKTTRGEEITLTTSADSMAKVKPGDRIPIRIHEGGLTKMRSVTHL